MKIEDEILQTKFQSAHQKALLNLIFTSNWVQHKQLGFFKRFGLTPHQFNILKILKGQYPKSISGTEIKNRMLDRNSDVSRLLDRLALKNLIDKKICPLDKRASDVSITQAGLDLLDNMSRFQKEMDHVLALTPEQAVQLSDLLDKCRS